MKNIFKIPQLDNTPTPISLSNLEEFKTLKWKIIDLMSFVKENRKMSVKHIHNIFNDIMSSNLFTTIVTKKELSNVDLKDLFNLPIIIKDPSNLSLTSISLKIDWINNKATIDTINGKLFLNIRTPECIYWEASTRLSKVWLNSIKISIDPKIKDRLEKDLSTNKLKIKNILSFEYIELVENEQFIDIDIDKPYLNPFVVNEDTYNQIVEILVN